MWSDALNRLLPGKPRPPSPMRFEIAHDPGAVADMDVDMNVLGLEIRGYDEGWPLLHYEAFPLRHVGLALEQMGGPVWSLKTEHGRERWRMGDGNLPVSDAVMEAIHDWFEDYLDWTSDDHLNPKTNPDFPFADFNRRGEELAARCRAELGETWTVAYLAASTVETG